MEDIAVGEMGGDFRIGLCAARIDENERGIQEGALELEQRAVFDPTFRSMDDDQRRGQRLGGGGLERRQVRALDAVEAGEHLHPAGNVEDQVRRQEQAEQEGHAERLGLAPARVVGEWHAGTSGPARQKGDPKSSQKGEAEQPFIIVARTEDPGADPIGMIEHKQADEDADRQYGPSVAVADQGDQAERQEDQRASSPAEQVEAADVDVEAGVDPGLVQGMSAVDPADAGAEADFVVRPPEGIGIEQRVAGDGVLPGEIERGDRQRNAAEQDKPAPDRASSVEEQVQAVEHKRQRHGEGRERAR